MTPSSGRSAARLLAAALLVAVCSAGCGDDEPTGASSEPTTEPTSEPTTEPTTETTEPTTETTTEPTTEPTTDPVEPTESVDPDAPVDLCTVDVSEIESAMGWTLTEEPSVYIGDGSCEFVFDAAELSVIYDPSSISELRDQLANFEIEDIEGVGDDAFSALSPFEITPASAAVAAGEGDTTLYLGSFSVDEIATVGEMVEGLTILARLCLEANA